MLRKQKTPSTIDSCEVECLPYLDATIASKYIVALYTQAIVATSENGSCYRLGIESRKTIYSFGLAPDLTLRLLAVQFIWRIINEIYEVCKPDRNLGTSTSVRTARKVRLQSTFQLRFDQKYSKPYNYG